MKIRIRRTLIQITALSIVLFVVTDYIETTWWFQKIEERRTIHVVNNHNSIIGERKYSIDIHRAVLEQQKRGLQATEEESSHVCGENEILNPKAESGTADGWTPMNSQLSVDSPGYDDNYALKAENRQIWFSGMSQMMDRSCFQVGDTWRMEFQVKLVLPDSEAQSPACQPELEDYEHCPVLFLGSNLNGGFEEYHHERIYDHGMVWNNDGGWNTFSVFYKLTEENAGPNVTSIYALIMGGKGDLVIDNINIERLESWEYPSSSPTRTCYNNVVYNGNAEIGSTEGWKSWGYPIHVVQPGATGQYALEEEVNETIATPEGNALASQYHFQSLNRTHPFHGMFQFLPLDSSCLEVGSTWKFKGKFRLYNPATNRSPMDACTIPNNSDFGDCPFMLFSSHEFGGPGHIEFLHDYKLLYSWDPYGWNNFEVFHTMTEDNAGPNKYNIRLSICGGNSMEDLVFLADDISAERLEDWETPTISPTLSPYPTASPTAYCNQNWAGLKGFHFNDEAILTHTSSDIYEWKSWGHKIGAENPGYGDRGYALKAYDRSSWANGPFLWGVDASCVNAVNTWRLAAKVKLYDQDTGAPSTKCTPGVGLYDCPFVRFLAMYYDHPSEWLHLYMDDLDWKTDGSYSILNIEFTVPDNLVRPDLRKFAPFFVGGPSNTVLVLDDVVVQRLEVEAVPTAAPSLSQMPSSSPTAYCSKNFIRNHDGEFGTTAYWMRFGSNSIRIIEPGYGGERYALQAYNRDHGFQGIAQRISPFCFEEGSAWRMRFRAKLTDSTGAGITTCDPLDPSNMDCPMIRMVLQRNNGGHYIAAIRDSNMIWNPNDWNTFDFIWKPTVDEVSNGMHYVFPSFCGGPANSTLTIDDAIIERLEDWETPTTTPTLSSYPSMSPTTYCSQDFVINGKVDVNSTDPWHGWKNPVRTQSPGADGTGLALAAYNRTSWHRGLSLRSEAFSCMTLNSTWHIKAKVKLYDEATGAPITTAQCNPLNTLSNRCPMVRTVMGKNAPNTPQGEEHSINLWRDTGMVWNDNGDWATMDFQITLTPDLSGPDLTFFIFVFVGGPVNSVLLLDDISITRVDDESLLRKSAIAAEPKICHSIGDPHIQTFSEVLYDNHEAGWQTLFSKDGVVIEAEQESWMGIPTVRYNRAYRVSRNGVIIDQGENGQVPMQDGGQIFIYFPFTVWIKVLAIPITWHDSTFHMYNIYITTSEYEGATGLCNLQEQQAEDESSPVVTADADALKAANEACRTFEETKGIHEACVRDILLLNAADAEHDVTAEVVHMSAEADSVEHAVQRTIQQVILPEDGSSESDDAVLAHEVELAHPESSTEVNSGANAINLNVATGDDISMIEQSVSMADAVEAEGDEQAESVSGVEGDPFILGLKHQSFDFKGHSDEWYANFASESLQWNMKFHHFDTCAGEEAMYVTSMALSVERGQQLPPHRIVISITDESEVFPGCANNEVCLSQGSLQINVDGEILTKPGDYILSDDLRIVSYNTWEACARKWNDYTEGIHSHDYLWDNQAVHRRLKKKKSSFFDILPSFTSPSTGRDLMSARGTLDFLRQTRKYMVAPHKCSDWIEKRTNNGDLFQQDGGWANVYIETPQARFQIQHRQIRKEKELLENGGSGVPEDIIVEGMLFEGNRHKCQAHVLDGWLTHTSHDLKQENWHGILGETQTVKYNEAGNPILTNRNRLLLGGDEDYHVIHAFATDFPALHLNTNMRRLMKGELTWQKQEQQGDDNGASSNGRKLRRAKTSSSSLLDRIIGKK